LGLFSAVLLAAVTALAPLKPATNIDLSSQGSLASDVAWLNDDEVLVALLDGGVVRVSLASKQVASWVPMGALPDGSPYPELVASDGNVVVVMGAGKRNYMFRQNNGKYLYGYMGGRLYPRGVAVVGGKAVYMGWMGQAGTDAAQLRGVLWTQAPGEELSTTPMHRILGSADAVTRWRVTAPPYAGSVVALPNGSVAVMNVAEPGIYRYDRNGKLVEVLASGVDSLLLDTVKLTREFSMDVAARYQQLLNRQAMIDDLVATPDGGVAILVRTAANGNIGWELWHAGRTDINRRQPLATTARGPFGHMRCESRGTRLACVTNLPTAEQAKKPETAGANPRLLLFTLPR
jgi:hypothetical protein